MPIYEYLCESCGKKFEVLQKFSDDPLTAHPDCGGKVEKLISTSALQFKGSGWYVNDYAKTAASKPGETRAETKSDTGKSDSGDSKSESKAETKTESKPAAATPASTASSSTSTDSK